MTALDRRSIATAQNFATIRAIRTLPYPDRDVYFASGKTIIADTGVGIFYWSPTAGASDDDATVLRPNDRPASDGRWLKFSLVDLASAFPEGDSLTEGLRGDVGGWRSKMTTPYTGRGPLTDPTGRKHNGVGGRTLATMATNFAAEYAGNESDEVWVEGVANDFYTDGVSVAVAVTRGTTLLTTIEGATLATTITRWGSTSLFDDVHDANIVLHNRSMQQEVAVRRATGKRTYFHDAGGMLVVGDLDAIITKHPSEAGYLKWAQNWDRYLLASRARDFTAIGGCVGAYDAEDASNVLTGALFDQVTDLSGSGRHLLASGATRPTKGALALDNGRQWAKFSGAQWMRTATDVLYSAQPITHVIVGQASSNVGDPAFFDGAGLVTGRNLLQGVAAGPSVNMFAGTGIADNRINAVTFPHIYATVFNGASSKFYVDGCQRRVPALNPGAQGCGGLTWGGSAAASPTALLTGAIGDHWIFNKALTDDEVFDATMFLNLKHSIWPTSIGQQLIW